MKPSRRRALALAAILAAACADRVSPLDPASRSGPLDLSRVVAVGDGFAAGAMDDALYRSGQEGSILALFAGRAAGDADVLQPLVADPGFGIQDPAGGRLVLESAFPPRLGRLPRGGPVLETAPGRPYDNLGVPLAILDELLTARSSGTSTFGNPFFDVVLRDRGTVVEQVAELDPTLILLWAGTADVLIYAANGGDPAIAPGLPTPPASFAVAYETLLDALIAITGHVVVFDVPDVGSMPLAAALPPHVVDPETGEPVTITVIEPVIDPDTGEPVIDPVTGDTLMAAVERPLPLIGPEGPLSPDDRVVLSAAPLVAAGTGVPANVGGTGEPLPDRAVLSAAERAEIAAAVAGYNAAIHAAAAERNLAVVEVVSLVAELQAGGILSDGVRLTAAWPAGQMISLDGVRFTAKGYGVVVNRLIDALNERYGSTLLHIRTDDLLGVPLF